MSGGVVLLIGRGKGEGGRVGEVLVGELDGPCSCPRGASSAAFRGGRA